MISMPPMCGIFFFVRGVMALAATRLIPMRKNKGKSIGACLHNHTSYIQNPGKTEQGELVSSYQCSPLTVDEEFLLTKRLYEQTTGRSQKSDVIAYQVRQSFKPGEVTPEEANRIGYEFAERFLKGKHAFIVATHTDRAHIHNHIIYNSTALDGTRKFKNFWLSTFAVQRLSDLICLEHQLSTIEYKPYRERQKRIVYPPKESNRDRLCGIINTILAEKPEDYEAFLQKLEQQGYEVKRGKHTAVKGKGQKRFIRFRTLGIGYSEEEIKAVLEGKAKHHPYQKQPPKEQPFQLLVDRITPACAGKSFRAKLPILSIRDHPRVCGEKEARAWPKEQVWGSPPRMRGKVAIPDDAPRFERITPAYAGKSRSQGSHTAPPGDHPRVCGEKLT